MANTTNGMSDAFARLDLQASPRTASLLLHVLVIGGGTTGLAAAYAIRQAGHTVHVLEARPGLEEVRVAAVCELRSLTTSLQDHNCAGMFRAWIDDRGKALFKIWHDEKPSEEYDSEKRSC